MLALRVDRFQSCAILQLRMAHQTSFREAFKFGRHVLCAQAQKHKIGNTLIIGFFGPMNELKKNDFFDSYELNSHQRHFILNMDEFQSNHANWKCDVDYVYLFIC